MNLQPLIRQYKTGDKDNLLYLLELNTPTYFSPDEATDFVDYLDNKIEEYFVVEVDSVVVGCGGINFADGGKTGIISWDILHSEYQGRSLGSMLLKYRLNRLSGMMGVQRIIVRTSQLTHKFYEKNGFKLVEIVEDHWAKGYHLYLMQYEPTVL